MNQIKIVKGPFCQDLLLNPDIGKNKQPWLSLHDCFQAQEKCDQGKLCIYKWKYVKFSCETGQTWEVTNKSQQTDYAETIYMMCNTLHNVKSKWIL